MKKFLHHLINIITIIAVWYLSTLFIYNWLLHGEGEIAPFLGGISMTIIVLFIYKKHFKK